MDRLAALMAVLALMAHSTAQGELGSFLADSLGVTIVEEAVNEWGTTFLLLDGQSPPASTPIEEQLKEFMAGQADGSAVVVYPHPSGPGPHGTHFATTIRKYPSGHASVTSDEWGAVLRNAERAFWLDFADVVFGTRQLEYTYGSTKNLSETPETLLRDPYVPPPGASLAGSGRPGPAQRLPGRTTCTSSSSQFGSSTTCSTNGLVTYQSYCTVDSLGIVTCRSSSR